MSDSELNFNELFEKSKQAVGRSASALSANEDRSQPSQQVHYIADSEFRMLDLPPKFHKKAAVNHAQMRMFKRQQNNPKLNEIDLHGYRREQAVAVLSRAIAQCQSEGIVCLRVIFGKGLCSAGQPILRKTICSYMIACPEVLAYQFAKPRYGGDGAACVMLRRP